MLAYLWNWQDGPGADTRMAMDADRCFRATVAIYLLDTDVAENHADDRSLTDYLYGGDNAYRLRQEAILGMDGVKMLASHERHEDPAERRAQLEHPGQLVDRVKKRICRKTTVRKPLPCTTSWKE